MTIFLEDEQATIAFGQKLATLCTAGTNIYLYGDLGAGKTTLVRGLIQTFLPEAKVKSPTYTLVEDYEINASTNNPNKLNHVYHFDLYRLGDPEELEYIGGRDYFSGGALCLVEWPQRGDGWLAKSDLDITIEYKIEGRNITLNAHSDNGKVLSDKLKSKYATI